MTVIHDEPASRFVIRRPEGDAVLQYRCCGASLDFYRTYVPESLRGLGLAEQLATAAFEYATSHHLSVVPTCSYISGAYLTRHPEYQSLVSSP